MRSNRRSKRHDPWRNRLSIILIVAGIALILTPLMHTAYAWAQQELMSRGIYVLGRPDVPIMVGEPIDWEPPPVEDPDQLPTPDPSPDPDPKPPPAPPKPTGPIWRIEIPKLKVSAFLIYGTEPHHLAKGPGVYPQGVKPGESGNISIAGHRNAYGRWFRHLDKLVAGDEISIAVDDTSYIYLVEYIYVVQPNDWSPIRQTDYDAVTLTTCHPYGSTAERLIVRGRLEWISDKDGRRPANP